MRGITTRPSVDLSGPTRTSDRNHKWWGGSGPRHSGAVPRALMLMSKQAHGAGGGGPPYGQKPSATTCAGSAGTSTTRFEFSVLYWFLGVTTRIWFPS